VRETKLCNSHGPHQGSQCMRCIAELHEMTLPKYVGPIAIEADDPRTLARIIAFLRAPNEDGSPCSVEREMLARRIERGEHRK